MKRLYGNCLFKLLITPFTYAICGAAIIFAAVQFFIFQRFFSDVGTTDLHRFFSAIPYVCVLAIPALGSFISFSREDLSLPVAPHSLILAKTLALLTVSAASLVLTLFVPISVSWFGDVDVPSLVCGYLGLMLYLVATCAFSVLIYTMIENTGFAFVVQAIILFAVNAIHLLASYIHVGDFLSSIVKWLSFSWHFDAAGKGIIDSRDIVFYISVAAMLVLAGTCALESKRGGPSKFIRRLALLSIAGFVLLSIDSSRIHFRLDTTVEKKFSVSSYSKSLLDDITEPMTITYYRSSSLKNLYPQVRDIEDFLEDFASHSKSVSYSIVDPVKENVADKLLSYGVQGQRINTSVKDTTSYTTVYSAVVINYLGENMTIPFVLSSATLEFNLAEKIQSMVRENTRFVQVVIGNGLSIDEDYAYIKPWLETQGFHAVQTYLPSEIQDGREEVFTLYPNVPLVVFGTALFTQEDSQALINFIRGGGKVFLATSPYTVDIKKDWSVIPVRDYVVYGLQEFGIYYRDTITSSKDSFSLGLYSQVTDGVSPKQTETTSYTMWPVLGPQENAINGLTAFWPSAIDFDNDVSSDSGYTVSSYLQTGEGAWQSEKVSGKFITNPFSISKEAEEGEETGKYNLAVAMRESEEKIPALIATGDQYAYTAEMIGYSSSQSSVDTRSLDLLSNSLLLLSGETSLLELKMSAKGNTSLYKIDLDRLYSLKIPVLIFVCACPVAVLLALAVFVSIFRKRLGAGVLK